MVSVEFEELYRRHLCRHSQLGINVVHLLALFGVWLGTYGLIYGLLLTAGVPQITAQWVPVGLGASYLLVLLPNLPLWTWAATVVFMALFVAAVLGLGEVFHLPWHLELFVYLLMVPVFYKIQALSHKVWTIEHDMTEFNRKYVKGRVLFVVLLFYEVPVLLHYLLFGRKDWAT
jgi:hypothetical protein